MKAEVLNANPDSSPLGHARKSFVETLRQQKRSVALIEGCTGGALSDAITMPGASRIISGAVTPYSKEAKIRLGIPAALIDRWGEYSLPVASAMANLSQRKQGTDLGIGVVGDLERDRTVYTAYHLIDGSSFEDVFTLNTYDRRRMNNEITVRVLTTANALLHGQNPQFAIPVIGEPAGLFTERYNTVNSQARSVIGLCQTLGLTIGTMESCTGLAMADKLTNVPGGNVFQAGFLAYNENIKMQLGVPVDALVNYGVYSPEVAAKMAECVIDTLGVDIAFATTGVLDVWDKRPYHKNVAPGTVSMAIAQKGRPTWSNTERFRVETRDAMKLAITSSVFGRFLDMGAYANMPNANVSSDLSPLLTR